MYSLDDMEDKDLLLALIISHIAGESTKIESDALMQMIVENEEIEKLFNEVNDVLMRDEIVTAREESWKDMPVFVKEKHPLSAFLNRHAVKLGMAAMVLFALMIFMHKTDEHTLAVKACRDSIQLTLNNGGILDLGAYDTIVTTPGVHAKRTYFLAANQQNGSLHIPAGRTSCLILPDGTVFKLNAATTFKFDKERHVTLSGRADVTVARNAGKPFIIKLPNSEVRVLGTHFIASSYNGQEGVSLMSGRVAFVKGKECVELQPGEEIYTQPDLSLKKNSFVVADMERGEYTYNLISIETLAELISRFFRMEVKIAKAPSNEKYSGAIEYNLPVTVFLNNLSEISSVKYSIDGNTIVLN